MENDVKPSAVCDPARQRPTERAFVVQFDAIDMGRGRFRGRVELVATGDALRFRSQKALVAFMISTLLKRAQQDAIEPN
jgi:hypothetical protein